MDDSTLWRWVMNIGAVLLGGAWLGRVQQRTTSNEQASKSNKQDIDKVLNRLDTHTREAAAHSDRVHALSERIAVLETKADVNTIILNEIREAVKK